MPTPIPSPTALRALRHTLNPLQPLHHVPTTQQVRHATLLKRPKRPYTFTQLITLSDGSSFTLRTTNPQAVYKSAKDIRNSPTWNPSSQKLLNVEEDEAGKLAAFRAKFGRGWDVEGETGKKDADHFMDLISGGEKAGTKAKVPSKGSQVKPPPKVEPKKK